MRSGGLSRHRYNRLLERASRVINGLVRRLQRRSIDERFALLRVLIHRRMGVWLVGDRLARLPSRYLDSLLGTEASLQRVDAHRVSTIEILPARIETYGLLERPPPRFHRSRAFDPLRIHRLHDVVVSPQSGLMWLPEGFTIGESVGSLHRMAGWDNVTHELLRPVRSVPNLDRPVVSALSRNFAHWLFECLPSIGWAIEHDPSALVLLPEDSDRYPPFVEESLRVLVGNDGIESGVVRASGPIRVPTALLVQQPVDPYFVRKETLLWVRETFASDGRKRRVEAPQGRRLYVSRSRVSKRRLINELDVHALVESLGFEVLFAEDLTFSERSEVFSSASIVAGPHGAGLANAVWCPPGSVLFELLPSEWYNDYYARMAASLELRYDFVQCGGDRRGGYLADLRSLDEALGRILEENPH